MTARTHHIAQSIESLVTWARALDSREGYPFGDLNLTRQQVEVLFLLTRSPDGLAPGVIADQLQVTKGAVTQLVSGLITAGLTHQETDATDARRRVIALTDSARRSIAEFEHGIIDRLAPRFDALDDLELQTLSNLLAKTAGKP